MPLGYHGNHVTEIGTNSLRCLPPLPMRWDCTLHHRAMMFADLGRHKFCRSAGADRALLSCG